MHATDRLHVLRIHDRWFNGFLAVGTLAVAMIAYLCLLIPLDAELQEARTQIAAFQSLVQQTTDIAKRNHELEDLLRKSQRENTELLRRIPTAPRESDFLTEVCQLAEGLDLDVLDYQPGAVHRGENHHEMEVRLSTSGEYSSLCRFLAKVDHLPRLCRLAQLEITPAIGTRLSAEMTFRIYFAPPTDAEVEKRG